MLIAFIIGLFILNVVFGIKYVEVKRGSKIVLKRFRARADEKLAFYWSQVCRQTERGLVRLREIWLTAQWSTRRWLARKLRDFSRWLHN